MSDHRAQDLNFSQVARESSVLAIPRSTRLRSTAEGSPYSYVFVDATHEHEWKFVHQHTRNGVRALAGKRLTKEGFVWIPAEYNPQATYNRYFVSVLALASASIS